ncbi:hypothetical protein SLUN_35870 [Streptomyces lunaelactis]|uniref:Lipoprotein n=1 Tax=Streptomyces lunaelactis TaxID=1535768 RepID=A0A2R4TCD8_9ACTN|nr:hypothetical protein [Streptomyces lunaelactis]AVZ76774.1 hypothetical protein SLUN_35870 [Streptomyces lunaelactis]NUK86199.1 hypothetical protein [Streptomyces lunaelactis]
MTQIAGQRALTLMALALAAGVLTGCSEADADAEVAKAPPSARAAQPARAMPFELYTHCGIDEARIGSTYFEAKTPLSNGAGSPPEGWDNPYQRGTMTLKSPTEAVFTDDAGHEVTFRARPGADAFKRLCR